MNIPPNNATSARLSIVTPAFNEEANLPLLYEQLISVLSKVDMEWEWIIVDDHSSDETFAVIDHMAQNDARIRGVRFSRNFGSHNAILCGLTHARGVLALIMAADLQDPPEVVPDLIEKWQQGVDVVWAVRASREGEGATTIMTSRLFYWVMRHWGGVSNTPDQGADFFIIDRKVMDALLEFRERNMNLFSLLLWSGFEQDSVAYVKKARHAGESGWSLAKKVKLLVDSVTSFSYLPIRVMSVFGLLLATSGFIYSLIVVLNWAAGNAIQGWSSLMIVVLVMGGAQMLFLGILGEYLWRSLDESRRRPRYLIESSVNLES